MAGTFGDDLFDTRDMTDDELRSLVIEHLQAQTNLDADEIDVDVRDGVVTLSGRVGTDAEVEIAGEVLSDVLGLEMFTNELAFDPLRRGTTTIAADEDIAGIGWTGDSLGGSDQQQSDTAEHLMEDLQSETLGTHDMSRAIRDGSPYSPPDGPVGDGYGSRENH